MFHLPIPPFRTTFVPANNFILPPGRKKLPVAKISAKPEILSRSALNLLVINLQCLTQAGNAFFRHRKKTEIPEITFSNIQFSSNVLKLLYYVLLYFIDN